MGGQLKLVWSGAKGPMEIFITNTPALCPVDPQIDRVGGGSEDPPITTYLVL